MRRYFISIFAILALIMPMQSHAQSGDASVLDSMEGLEQAIGRSWVTPFMPVSASDGATPAGEADAEVSAMNAIIYEFDSSDNAAAGLEKFDDDQQQLIKNDPNTPASTPFDTDGLGDAAYGYEGTFPMPGPDGEMVDAAIVSLNVQQDNLVIQLFGTIAPGNHIEITTQIAEDILAADAGEDDVVLGTSGDSTGGLWEKLNAIEISVAPGTEVYDLQIYPIGEDAVRGESVTVPEIDLDNIGAVPGLVGSWYAAYGYADAGTPAASPVADQTGPFSIELWVMEFEDPGHASAAAFSMQQSLTEPLRIVHGDGDGLTGEGSQDLVMESTGFTGDTLPEGDAGVVIRASGTTVYASRVYTREPAPTPIARNLVNHLADTPAGSGEETDDGVVGTGGVWDRFPQAGDDLLYDLVPVVARYNEPAGDAIGTPMATPAG